MGPDRWHAPGPPGVYPYPTLLDMPTTSPSTGPQSATDVPVDVVSSAVTRTSQDAVERHAGAAAKVINRLAAEVAARRSTAPLLSGTVVVAGTVCVLALATLKALALLGKRRGLLASLVAAGGAWLVVRTVPSRDTASPSSRDAPVGDMGVAGPSQPSGDEDQAIDRAFWWIDRICAVPVDVSTVVQGADNELEFMEQLLGDCTPMTFVLDQLPQWRDRVDADRTVLMARYPSRAIRSVASETTTGDGRIEFTVDDRSVFLDPRGPTPALTGKPVRLEMTLFAIDCPEVIE